MKDATLFATLTLLAEVVSIRAPVKDATRLIMTDSAKDKVSIRAPVKDATLDC